MNDELKNIDTKEDAVNNPPQIPSEKSSPISISKGWKKVPMYLVPAKDAKQFGKNQQNRMIDEKHVAKIKKGYVESLPYLPPITVNSVTGNIIDGQHRLQAFFELIEEGILKSDASILTRFIEADEDEVKLIQDANTKTKVWNQNDFINSYRTVNDNYSKLTEWCLNHRLTHKEGKPIYRYASAIIKGKSYGAKLKKGEFAVSDDEWKNAEENYNGIYSIIENCQLSTTGAYIESIALSWFTHKNWLLSAFGNMDNFLAFLRKEKMLVWKNPHNSKQDWERVFTELYYKACGKVIIYDKALKNSKYPFRFGIMNDDFSELIREEDVTDENIVIPNIEDVIRTDE